MLAKCGKNLTKRKEVKSPGNGMKSPGNAVKTRGNPRLTLIVACIVVQKINEYTRKMQPENSGFIFQTKHPHAHLGFPSEFPLTSWQIPFGILPYHNQPWDFPPPGK